MAEPILLARHGDTECFLLPAMANRHGLVTGATGTGKTVTLQTLAENFSRQGVPVFMADVKGDLTGITQPGSVSPKMAAILKERGIEAPAPAACPATLWDVFADDKAAVRPSGARDGERHGAAAARAHARPQRDAAGRAPARLQDRRRQRPAAARPQGPARDAAARRRQLGAVPDRLRQRQRGERRRDPARPDADQRAGRRQVLRRADARHRRLHADRGRAGRRFGQAAGRRSTSSPPTSC